MGINRNTLHKKLSEYRLDDTDAGEFTDTPNLTSSSRCNGNATNQDYDENSENHPRPGKPVLPVDKD